MIFPITWIGITILIVFGAGIALSKWRKDRKGTKLREAARLRAYRQKVARSMDIPGWEEKQ